jgi:hypothetical protein
MRSAHFVPETHFSKSITEHIRDFDEAEKKAMLDRQEAKKRWAQMHRDIMRESSRLNSNTLDGTTGIPAVLPSHGEDDAAEFKPLDFDLLHQLLPEYNYPNSKISRPEQLESPFDTLPGLGWIRLLIIEPRSKDGFRCHLKAVELPCTRQIRSSFILLGRFGTG